MLYFITIYIDNGDQDKGFAGKKKCVETREIRNRFCRHERDGDFMDRGNFRYMQWYF